MLYEVITRLRRIFLMLRAVLQFILLFTTIFAQAETFQVISYHDVVSIEGKPAASDDIGVRHLADHFEWLQANGYNVISVQDLVDARNGVSYNFV